MESVNLKSEAIHQGIELRGFGFYIYLIVVTKERFINSSIVIDFMGNDINSSREFNRGAYKYCPNITTGWERGFNSLFQDSEKNKMVLDVGCGNQAEFLREGPHIYGIDPNLGIQRFLGDEKIHFTVRPYAPERAIIALAEELPFREEVFDYAISMKAVGWYPRQINLEMAVREMLRVVKKKTGVVFFNVGQEMSGDVINPVLEKLASQGFNVNVDRDLVIMSNPDYEVPK